MRREGREKNTEYTDEEGAERAGEETVKRDTAILPNVSLELVQNVSKETKHTVPGSTILNGFVINLGGLVARIPNSELSVSLVVAA